MTRLSKLVRMLRRFLLVWAVDAVSLAVAAALLPGMAFLAGPGRPTWLVALVAALTLGLVNFCIRPLLLLAARPFGLIATLIVGFFVNALALLLTAALLPGFWMQGLLPAIVGGIILAAVNTVLTGLLTLDDADSFYEQRILRMAQQSPFAAASSQGRALLMLEIDGVSYRHLEQAVALGYMPTLRRLIDTEGYVLTRIDCGLPAQTSACQAGILFGNNYDIPAFRWFDKRQQKLYVSHSDSVELNQRHSNGQGLVRGGSSINNMFDGDAEKALMTLSRLRPSSPDEGKRRAEDVSLLMLNPYFFTRTIALFLGEAALDVWQAFWQRARGVWPRLNRLKMGYPFKRAATTVFLREAAHNLVALDMMRGSPAIYTTFAGYDKVAHHSGPWTRDAFAVLKRYDREVAQLRDIARRHAPRPYELILLSDHGQSFGATFLQRYGVDLKGFIQQQMPQGTSVAQSWGGDDGLSNVGAIGVELQNAQALGLGGRAGRVAAGELAELAEPDARPEQQGAGPGQVDDAQAAADADVIVCATGNLAHVYFDFAPDKVTLSQIQDAYPGLVDALVQHEGVGFVVGYDDDGAPLVIGKRGRRHLVSGEVSGADPLLPFAVGSRPSENRRSRGAGLAGQNSVEVRAWQVRRMVEFPSAGDLIVNGALYPDGTVAAFEELIGSHGGLGGEQTDAFLLHPPDMPAPETRNSEDFFHLLNARRRVSAVEP
ncbi:MAG TPA: phage holin family protein [Anaerolineae bacterium]|nr:phage holin family protein [Anaerolineae bacterium]HNS04018.1 phage holin family protein [Anaerolineae bacterium]HNU05791.1 phage holin family protein [Anaerolineae bacterium]